MNYQVLIHTPLSLFQNIAKATRTANYLVHLCLTQGHPNPARQDRAVARSVSPP